MRRSLVAVALALLSCSTKPPRPSVSDEYGLPRVLAALSSLAREIDSGKLTLPEVRASDQLPDRLMSSVRRLVKTSPANGNTLLAYLRSNDEPIAARLMAVLSLAHCWEPHVLALMGAMLSGGADDRLAATYVRSYWIVEFKEEPDWIDLLPSLRTLGGLSSGFEYLVFDYSFGRGWMAVMPHGVNPAPVLEGLLDYMERETANLFPTGYGLASELFLKCPDPMPELRARFPPFLERHYLSDVPIEMWRSGMDALVRSTGRPGHLEIIARGLDKFSFAKRMETINELCAYGGDAILQEPFQKHVTEALNLLSRSEAEGGPPPGSPYHLIPHLLLVGEKQGWPETLLLKSPSIDLRRRAAKTLERFMDRGSPPSNWDPWMDLLSRMLEDPDLEIQLSAVTALVTGLHARWQRLNKPAYGDQVEAWRRRLEDWFAKAPQNHAMVEMLRRRMRHGF